MDSKQPVSVMMMFLFTCLVLGGCGSPPERQLSDEVPVYVALPNGGDPRNPEQISTALARFEGSVIKALEQRLGRRLKILQLSGGGQKGAFGAGVMVGWTESGFRPKFDIVTGVSVGALLSTSAFLGTDEDDEDLERLFTTITSEDVYRRGGFGRVIMGATSIHDSEPLAKLLEDLITPRTLERVAGAAREGRVLAVTTLNLDYQQVWVWDLTKLALTGGAEALDTYRKVLLASASPPMAFPPVEINGSLHADGGTRERLFVTGMVGLPDRSAALEGTPGEVYVVFNDRLRSPPRPIRASLSGVIGSSLNAMLNGQMETTLVRSYALARLHGYQFRLQIVPDEVETGINALAFDPVEMRGMFDAGRALGRDPSSWLEKPPSGQSFSPWVLKAIDDMGVK